MRKNCFQERKKWRGKGRERERRMEVSVTYKHAIMKEQLSTNLVVTYFNKTKIRQAKFGKIILC